MAIRKSTLFKCIENIEKVIDTRFKYPKSKAFFLATNRQVERVSEIIFMVVMKILFQLLILPECIASFGVYFFTDSGRDSFEIPFLMWFPFDWKNPVGYSITVVFDYILVGYEFFTATCTIALGIGAFWFAISATKEIHRVLHSINHKAKVNANANKSDPNGLKIMFAEYIHAHAIVIQVEHDFSDIFQPIFITLFTWSLLAISGAMFIIQVELLHHGNVLALLVAILNGLFAFSTVFIACEIGQRMNDAFEKINFTIERMNWYLFPSEIQRMLPMITATAQKPIVLKCFGSIVCTREAFKEIIHHAYSYFMMLRQFAN